MPGLEQLISDLESCNGPVDLERICEVIRNTRLGRSDIEPYCVFSETTYHRNPVSSSRWYELLVMCWHSGQKSAIHDHRGSGCAFKIVEGQASEMVFERSTEDFVKPVLKRSYQPGEICMARDADIHQIYNEQFGRDLITLHLYSPPLNMTTYQLDPGFLHSPVGSRAGLI